MSVLESDSKQLRALNKLGKKFKKLKHAHAEAAQKAEQERECLIQECDAAHQEVARVKSKKCKKKSKDRNSTKFNGKLNLLADKLGVDFNGLDSSDSEADPIEAKCQKEEKRSEFNKYGLKKSPPEYFGMRGEGLRHDLKVDKNT